MDLDLDPDEMDHLAVACAEDHLDVADAVLMRTCLGLHRKAPKAGIWCSLGRNPE
jgi:hypothetical protein